MLADLELLIAAHARFARWECARHRADFAAKLFFPDSHPLRNIVDDLANCLDDCRWSAEMHLVVFAQQYGEIRGIVNGRYFDSTDEWFRRSARYWDCPDILVGKGVRRTKIVDLAGLDSLRQLEGCGKSFIHAVDVLRDNSKRRRLTHTSKTFNKGVARLENQLKRVKVCKVCPREKVGVLLCLQRVGLPTETGRVVLGFLV